MQVLYPHFNYSTWTREMLGRPVWKHAGVLLLFLVSTVESDCERGGTCGDADKALADIAGDPSIYQQCCCKPSTL